MRTVRFPSDPGAPTPSGPLPLGIDLDPYRLELGDHPVEVVDTVVDHERGLARAEVLRVLLEERPDR